MYIFYMETKQMKIFNNRVEWLDVAFKIRFYNPTDSFIPYVIPHFYVDRFSYGCVEVSLTWFIFEIIITWWSD